MDIGEQINNIPAVQQIQKIANNAETAVKTIIYLEIAGVFLLTCILIVSIAKSKS